MNGWIQQKYDLISIVCPSSNRMLHRVKRKDRAFIREQSENIQRLREEASVVSWETVFEQTDPSIAFEKFNTIVTYIY